MSASANDGPEPDAGVLSGFVELPRELQVMILHQVYTPVPEDYLIYLGDGAPHPLPLETTRELLKPLRLISWSFHDAVTPIIFSTVHIHSSEPSLRRAESIAGSRLAGHVREIVYHEGGFAAADPDKAKFLQILNSHRRRQDYPKKFPFPKDDELYQNYLGEIRAGKAFQGFEINRMTTLVGKFPRCVTFTPVPEITQWCDPVKSAYSLRRTGLAYPPPALLPGLPNLWPEAFGPTGGPGFIATMVEWKPRALVLSNFSYQYIGALFDSVFRTRVPLKDEVPRSNWADQLEYLRLGWPDDVRFPGGFALNPGEYVKMLELLLQHAHNLIHLELTHGFETPPGATFAPVNGLSRLEYLTISRGNMNGLWAEEALCSFIRSVGPTLKHLRFDDIGLINDYQSTHHHTRRDGSLIRLLFNITPFTNLESCSGLDVVWDVKHCIPNVPRSKEGVSTPKCDWKAVLEKVEDAVCGRRPWPEGWDMSSLENMPIDASLFILDGVTYGPEAAFLLSHWDDTVDPWDGAIQQEGSTQITGNGGSAPEVFRESVTSQKIMAASKTKRGRIRKILGLGPQLPSWKDLFPPSSSESKARRV